MMRSSLLLRNILLTLFVLGDRITDSRLALIGGLNHSRVHERIQKTLTSTGRFYGDCDVAGDFEHRDASSLR